MSMPAPPSPDALAAAMRNGLAARRFFQPPSPLPPIPAPPAGLLPHLTGAAGVLGHPAPPGRGLIGRAGRLCRRAIKRLMNPWLERQTQFNHAAESYLRSVHDYLTDVAARVNALQADVARQAAALNTQTGPTACCSRPNDDPATAIPDDPIRVVEDLFLDTRLPPPPARVLVLTPNGQGSLDLASRGYQVVQCAADVGLVSISDRRSRPSDTDGKGPFPDESFDVVIALAGDRVNGPPADATLSLLARVLSQDGRVIGSGSAEMAGGFGTLRLVERVYAVRAPHGWSLTAARTDEADLTLWVAAKN